MKHFPPVDTHIYDDGSLHGSPGETIRKFKEDANERVFILPPILDRMSQPDYWIDLDEVIGTDTHELIAFTLATYLHNHMQSVVFDNTRENLLMCTPTSELMEEVRKKIYVVIVFDFASPCASMHCMMRSFSCSLSRSIVHLLAASLDNENKAQAREMPRCSFSMTPASSVAAIVTMTSSAISMA